ncbi:MAG: hypothetical protein ACYDHP_13790 [Ferrimicrobium sp.]
MAMIPGFEPVAEVIADARSRVAFGRAGVHSRDRFLVSVKSTGEILLTPLASIPKRELLVWENEQLRNSLMKGLDDYEHGRVRRHDSFLDEVSED